MFEFDTSTVEEVLRDLAHSDARRCSEDERLAAVVAMERIGSLVEVVKAHLLADLDADVVTDARFGQRTATWVAAQTGAARGRIAGTLRVGRALRSHFDEIDAAVSDGTLTFDHAKTLVDTSNPRTREALAAAQSEIISLAEGATFEAWKNDVAALAEVADTDGAEPDPYENLSLRMPVTLDRTVHLDGTLDQAAGLAFRHAVNTRADELFRRFTRDAEVTGDLAVPDRATLRALALTELVRDGSGMEPGSGSTPRAEITLVAHDHEVCDTDGVPLPRAAAEVWGCDPEIWGVVVDRMGIPVDVGHRNRLATVAATSCHHRPRRGLHLPRVRRPHRLVRPPPHHPVATRRTDRPVEPGRAVPAPSRGDAPDRLVDAPGRCPGSPLDHPIG